MKSPQAVDALAALAHGHRLAIYRLLVQSGPEGLSAGAIAGQVGILPSSLTFHIQSLQRAGLVTQTRASRRLIYAADFSTMNGLISYLTENCCGGRQSCATACEPVRAKRAATRHRRAA
jgi:ArsR family transcriptional regulator